MRVRVYAYACRTRASTCKSCFNLRLLYKLVVVRDADRSYTKFSVADGNSEFPLFTYYCSRLKDLMVNL